MKIKLLIWDFDGVVADTEKLWLENRRQTINETFSLSWSEKQTHDKLLGLSDKTKREVLDNLGLITDDAFWEKNKKLDYQVMLSKGFEPTQGIIDIFKLGLKQCIATGGLKEKTAVKIRVTNIESYFPPEHIFTADMVLRGKPEPDLFLFAAQMMGENPRDTIVIEDSPAGLTAAIKAGCTPVAFTKYITLNKREYLKTVKELGVQYIFDDMKDIKNFILSHM